MARRSRLERAGLKEFMESEPRSPESVKGQVLDNALFRMIYDQLPHLAGILNVEGTILHANRTACDLVGQEASALIGKPFWETRWWAHSQEEREKLQEGIRRAAGGTFVRFQTTHRDADGAIHDIDFSLKPVRDETGQVFSLIAEAQDMTEQKRAEDALTVANRRLRMIAEASRFIQMGISLQHRFSDEARLVREAFEADLCVIRILDGSDLVLLSRDGEPEHPIAERMSGASGIAQEMLSLRRALAIPDVRVNPHTRELAMPGPGRYFFVSYAGAPLLFEGKGIGILGIFVRGKRRDFSQTDLEHLQIVANNIAAAIVNQRLYEEILQQKGKLEEEIAERGKTEQALRDSQERYRNFITNASEGIYRIDLIPPVSLDQPYDRLIEQISGCAVVAEVNAALTEMYGITPERMLGRPVRDFAPDCGVQMADLVKSEGYRIVDREAQEFREDGQPVYIVESYFGVVEDRMLKRVWGVQRNVTERRKTEEERSRLIEILETTRDLVSTATPDGRLLYLNQAGRDLAGWGPSENLEGRFIADLHPEWAFRRISDEGIPVACVKGVWQGETAILARDGREIPVSQLIMAHRSPDGELRYMSTIMRDMTRSKQVEEQLRRNERRLSLAISATADAVWEWNLRSDETYFSPRWYEMLGYADCQFSMTLETWKDLCHSEDFPALMSSVQTVLGKPRGNAFQAEFRMRTADDSWKWVLGRGSVVEWNAAGQPVLLSGTNSDISERKEAEAERASLQEQLQQAAKMEAVGRLAGGVAHDFNNILTAIMGNVELGRLDLDPKDPLISVLDEIDKAAQSATSLTRQLLAFSRRQIVEPRVLNLNELIENLENMLARLIGEDIAIRIRFEEHLGAVRIDPGQFEQVLVNLAVNARDAMPNGGQLLIETANVDLDEAYSERHAQLEPGPYVLLAIGDTGQGMSEEVKQRLFEPFFTTKPKGRGTGLGTAMVFGAVKQAGGGIEVYSELGHGTTFKIYLPRVDEQAEKLTQGKSRPSIPKGSETVLLVEDETSVRNLALILLKRLGYEVLAASHGEEALALAEKHAGRIDLLMTDVIMPGMNGRELAERLGRLRPDLKVLFASGYTENMIAHHGVLEKNLNFIGKPYTMHSLAGKLREVLDRGRP